MTPSRRPRRGRWARRGRRGLPSISVVDLAARLRARDAGTDEFVLVDVREPGERDVVVIPGALAVPLGEVRAARDGRRSRRSGRHTGARALQDREPVPRRRCASCGRAASTRSTSPAGVLAWVRDVDPSLPTY